MELVEVAAGQDTGNVSSIFVAVSDDSNPNGTWHFDSIDAKEVIGGSDHWADYPGFAVDEEAVYITANKLLCRVSVRRVVCGKEDLHRETSSRD